MLRQAAFEDSPLHHPQFVSQLVSQSAHESSVDRPLASASSGYQKAPGIETAGNSLIVFASREVRSSTLSNRWVVGHSLSTRRYQGLPCLQIYTQNHRRSAFRESVRSALPRSEELECQNKLLLLSSIESPPSFQETKFKS